MTISLNVYVEIDVLKEEVASLRRRVAVLTEAMRMIAYEPFGAADATHAQVLDSITNLARAELARAATDELDKGKENK